MPVEKRAKWSYVQGGRPSSRLVFAGSFPVNIATNGLLGLCWYRLNLRNPDSSRSHCHSRRLIFRWWIFRDAGGFNRDDRDTSQRTDLIGLVHLRWYKIPVSSFPPPSWSPSHPPHSNTVEFVSYSFRFCLDANKHWVIVRESSMLFAFVLLYFALSAISASVSDPRAESGYVPSDVRVVITGGTNQDHRDKEYPWPSKDRIVIANGTNENPIFKSASSLPPKGQVYDLVGIQGPSQRLQMVAT